MYKPTEQQQNIIDTVLSKPDKIILAKAKAGCTKTSTSLLAIDAVKPKKALYTAFNKAIVMEGKGRFTSNVECRTLHALALSYVQPKLPIEDFTYLCIKEKLSYSDKRLIITAMDEFFRSSSVDMYEYLHSYINDKKLEDITSDYILGMLSDKVNPTFNFLLKSFHVLLAEGDIKPNYDMIIMDEIQDSTGVALAIFKELSSPIKLGLGDEFQSIYQFMNLVNGFEVLKDTITLPLTKSFRCSIDIANRIQNFGLEYLSSDFEFIGTDTPKEDNKTAYITLTNAGIINRINDLHQEGKSYTLTRKISEIFACPLALVTASSGKKVFHKKYKFLEKEYKNYTMSGSKSFFAYLKQYVRDDEIENAMGLIMRFNERNINIFDVMNEAKAVKPHPAILVSTAYSSKGLEFSDVYIEDDLNNAISKMIKEGGPETEEHLTLCKVAYVAASRARIRLHNCKYL